MTTSYVPSVSSPTVPLNLPAVNPQPAFSSVPTFVLVVVVCFAAGSVTIVDATALVIGAAVAGVVVGGVK